MTDTRLLFAAAFLRALATSASAIVLGVLLAKGGFEPSSVGLVVGSGLAGGAVAALFATLRADRLGRRRCLISLALLNAAGLAAVATVSTPGLLAAAAFLGMVNGMGRDRGASLVIEQAILPATTTDARRTQVFAWYNVLQDAGHAAGALLAAASGPLGRAAGASEVGALRTALLGAALCAVATAVLYLRLTPAIELAAPRASLALAPASRAVLWRISALFALDSLGGGFLTSALLSYFFLKRFGVGEEAIGLLFFGARLANAVSHLGAAWLARRIGLVNTMVFTHIPSSLLLLTVPWAPSFAVAAALFLLREGLVEMDVPTRQSYVMAVVAPEDRTVASGVTHLVRLAGWAAAPSLAGLLMQGLSLGAPLVIGATLKLSYDLMLWLTFRRLEPPEERHK